ncbi:MAG: protein translocase subunit SecF [bacterium]
MNVVTIRKYWYALSGIAVVLSIFAFMTWGLKLGIEFTGGSLVEYSMANSPISSEVVAAAKTVGVDAGIVTTERGVILRTAELDSTKHAALTAAIKKQWTDSNEVRFETVGPSISAELRSKALWAVFFTLLLICLYIAWAFRKVSGRIEAWKYGVLVVLAGVHDAIIPIGVFAVLGHYTNLEVTGAFVAAILTILGYSINDTIVVFDRVRENMTKTSGTVAEIVDVSIRQTAVRSINTSMTVILSLVAIFLFGGDSTKSFALALIIGAASGTYSSIFLATPLIVDWQKKR